MKELFDMISKKSSRLTTIAYSTSFSMGIKVFSRRFHDPIYGIYGFVRFADEIVDTFHDYDKPKLFERFREDTHMAIEDKISLNPILNNFQWVVNKYKIEKELYETFLKSMEMDLYDIEYDRIKYEEYILGSAEVVGLMCLRVFCEGDEEKYHRLKPSAMKLGAAFQKINFLRDLKHDVKGLGRSYFPDIDMAQFNDQTKAMIEKEIDEDFRDALEGIRQLPKGARFGVYVAYRYFYELFRKIRRLDAATIMNERIRISDPMKYWYLLTSYIQVKLNTL